jgi:uncharacterized protein (TIGR03435 family)
MSRTMRVLLLLACAALLGSAALAQSSSQNKVGFEVASVKPAAQLDMAAIAASMQAGKRPPVGAHVDGQVAEYKYMSLKQLIANAYNVKEYQINGPDWLAGDRFDIEAKIPDGASTDDVPKMLQSLLEERFKMTVHHNSKQGQVLALVVAKGGPKMKEATETPQPLDDSAPLKAGEMKLDTPNGPARLTIGKDGTATMNLGAKGTVTYKMDPATQAMRMEASSISMAGFADMLAQFSQLGGGSARPIVDKTGLKGNYQVSMDFPLADLMNMARAAGMMPPGAGPAQAAAALPGDAAAEPGGSSSLNESIAAMGLKLDPENDTVDELVVDHIEKAPTEN